MSSVHKHQMCCLSIRAALSENTLKKPLKEPKQKSAEKDPLKKKNSLSWLLQRFDNAELTLSKWIKKRRQALQSMIISQQWR